MLGSGLMGSQIGLEYALAGCEVVFCARDRAAATARLDAAIGVARAAGHSADKFLAEELVVVTAPEHTEACDLVIESLPEDASLKAEMLRRATTTSTDALFLSNTSSLQIAELADRSGLTGRMLGTHYWNPPLLMPLVELIAPLGVEGITEDAVHTMLVHIGKRPVRVSDAPGFAWNRLQFSLLREAAALTRAGIVSPEDLDLIVREGLARRWSLVGPFEAMALGGIETFARIADNLFPLLADDQTAGDLASNAYLTDDAAAERRKARDSGLAALVRTSRSTS